MASVDVNVENASSVEREGGERELEMADNGGDDEEEHKHEHSPA